MIFPLLRRQIFLPIFVFWFFNNAWALSLPSPAEPIPSAPEENIKVQTQQIEIGKTFTLPSLKPSRYLIANPEMAVVTEMKPDAIQVKAQKIGSTLIIWWEEGGIKSAQIVVTRPAQEIERTKEIKRQSSRLFQSHRSRSFKVSYDTEYSILEQEKVLPRVTEVRKIYNHQTRFQGNTPVGDLKGSLFYEYRKDQNLKKSVALVRDMWLSLVGTDFPFADLLDNYDMSVGRQYLKLSDFGFPGARYTGFTIVPSLKRIQNPERGRFDLSFFVGRERRGAFLDNPAGTSRRDLKLKNRLAGEKIDFYLWRDGRISLGSYQKWAGPTDATQSKKNSDMEFDFGFPHLRLKGETALDYRSNVAWRFISILENSWLGLENGFFRINPHYNTITGTTLDRGRRGYQLRSSLAPLKPFWGSDAISFTLDADITRDLLSLNPKRPDRSNKKLNVGMNWRLPYYFKNHTFFEYENKKSMSFPFTKRLIRDRISWEAPLRSRWVKRIRLYGISTIERYGDAEATPGFNSTRYELGGGSYISLFGGAWFSGQYLWNRLDEKEPTPRPDGDGRIYPGQLILAGGLSHSFRRLPVYVNMSVRYNDERKVPTKLHQIFPNEDRFEARGALNWKLPSDGVFFVEATAITTTPLTGKPEAAELSLIMGARLNVDTHVYLPQKGTIEGYFFLDKNANGVRDLEEPGIEGYEVWIQGGPRTRTNQKGFYRLRVQEGVMNLKTTSKLPEGYFFTTLNEQELEVLPKQKFKIDFGIVPQVQIKGQTYLDVNRNLIFDPSDIPMPAIQILLESGQMAVTSAQGLYSILRVRPGPNSAQVVVESIPSGYKTLTPIERKFEGMPGDVLTFDVAMTAERTVSGYVFEDSNKNGQRDPEEKGMPGVVITLADRKVTTAGDGRYVIADLQPGTQQIKIQIKSIPRGYKAIIREQKIEVTQGFFSKNDANFPLLKEIPRE